jgi:4-diphosphocytidyl-2-C-methyl-D-erythritol kinase
MIVFPNCKINLGLNITSKREDGFHNLETIFFPVMLKDVVEVIEKNDTIFKEDEAVKKVVFTSTGLVVDGNAANNLCVKAYNLLLSDFTFLPPIHMHLHKAIPMGAGLGGGSADGAFVLQLLNKKYKLNLSNQQLINYALQLGSDCPFFIINKPCFATGRGEQLEEINLNLDAYKLVLINPNIHINTGWAFSQIIPSVPTISIKDIVQKPIANWKDVLVNDFEEVVAKAHPAIATIKQQLYTAGAAYASMTGSGSTVFGLFAKEIEVKLSIDKNYWYKEVEIEC